VLSKHFSGAFGAVVNWAKWANCVVETGNAIVNGMENQPGSYQSALANPARNQLNPRGRHRATPRHTDSAHRYSYLRDLPNAETVCVDGRSWCSNVARSGSPRTYLPDGFRRIPSTSMAMSIRWPTMTFEQLAFCI
jgi:hypothetical protein